MTEQSRKNNNKKYDASSSKPDIDSSTIEQKPDTKSTAPKKKAASRKKSTSKKKTTKKSTANKAETKDSDNDNYQLNAESNRRVTSSTGRRSEDKVLPGLLQNLQGVFDKIYHDNRDQDRARDNMARDFNVHLQRSFKSMHKELEERERLLDRKLKSIDSTNNLEIKRVKLMSVPLMILTVVAIVYLFYVVRVMETAMTSMSQDMRQMTQYMESITHDTNALSTNTQSMVNSVDNMNNEISDVNQNVNQLNTTVNNLRVDVHHMSRSVSPTMNSINRFMP